MTAPINTYESNADLSLGQVPVEIEDPILYNELLDIHNAIESLVTHSDVEDSELRDFVLKQRNITDVSGDYTILITDGTIRVDASGGDVIITAHPVASGIGFRYNVKRVDLVTTSKVTLVGDGTEEIDDRPDGINISTKSSYTIKAHTTGYDII